jgi:hypothetical protein
MIFKNWFYPRVVVVDTPILSEDELAGAFAMPAADVRMRALLQVIWELEQAAQDKAHETVANHGMCASYTGGSEHMSMLRGRILDLQQKGFGKLGS